MTLQEFQAEVEDRTYVRMMTRLIEREQGKLREVPAGESYDGYVQRLLYEYVQAKLQAHWAKKRWDRTMFDNGSSIPDREWPKIIDQYFWLVQDTKDKVSETRARYYRAIGRKQKADGREHHDHIGAGKDQDRGVYPYSQAAADGDAG